MLSLFFFKTNLFFQIDKMISPTIVIINHFDELSKKVDIDFDQSIEKYNEKQTLGEIIICTEKDKYKYWTKNESNIFQLDKYERSRKNETIEWSESTTVIAYLGEVRKKTLNLLKQEQEISVDKYKNLSSVSKDQLKREDEDEQKSKLFADKFYFQIHFTQSDKRFSAFNLFTFQTDFYMSSYHIGLLQ